MYYCRNSWRDLEHTNPNRPRISYLHKKCTKGQRYDTIHRLRAEQAKQRAKGTWPWHKHAPHHTHTTTTQKHLISTYNLHQQLQHPLQPSTPKPGLQITPAASTNIFTPLPKTSTSIVTMRRLYRSVVATNVPARLPPAAP